MDSYDRDRLRRGALTALGVIATVGVVLFAWIWFAPCWLGGCAPVSELAEYQAEGSVLLDVDEEPYGTLATVNRRLVSLDSLPPHVPQAFLAVEDRRFYDHGGVDIRRLFGALVSNIQAGGVEEGGSTITQQLARNLFPEWLPYTERSLRRKLMEARVARQIERTFSKDKILELYVNHIYLGEGAYGVDAAARTYFGKPASELTLPEAALIGGLPKAPSRINPIADPELARERRDLVLNEMAEVGFVSPGEAAEAREQEIRVVRAAEEFEGGHGSYFIEKVRQEMEDVVGSRFYTAGLKIYTTMDSEAQSAAEEELGRQLDAVESGGFGVYRHETYPEAKDVEGQTGETPYLQGAVILMAAETGEIRALVGGRDFEDSKFDRAMQAQRQAGSAFKPFVYLAALERFGNPAHVVQDEPVRMVLSGGRVWEPKNYTGRYDGPITLRDALARSKNAATVHLAQEIGIDRPISLARQLGISGDIPNVPSTALGAASVRPIDMVRAYAAFANGGTRVEPHFIRRVVDRHGRTLWQATPRSERVLDPDAAFVLTTMLKDVVSRGTGTAARVGGYGGPAAGKTGTTNDAADVWFIGYTPELVGGVWIGMDQPRTIVRGASGGTIAAPVWGRMMGRVYSDRPTPSDWSPPPGVSTAEVERGTGMIVGEGCPARGPTYTEYFLGHVPMQSCALDVPYPQLAHDTAWIDEEWGAGSEDPDTATNLEEAGVDWPELEELRRRMRLGQGEAENEDTVAEDGAEEDARERRRRAEPPEGPAPTEPRPLPDDPPLLGEPVRRDTIGGRR